MKAKFIYVFAIALTVLCVCGCATNKLTRLEDLSPKEALAMGRFRVIYNGKDITKGSMVILNAPAFGANKYGGVLDETGYLFTRVPLGADSINFILHKNGLTQHHFKSGQLAFQTSEARTPYYIGDITMNWKGIGSAAAWTLFVFTDIAAGPVAALPTAAGATQGRIGVAVESRLPEAQEAFKRKFSNEKELVSSLLAVNPQK